jgi:hypothetical protein
MSKRTWICVPCRKSYVHKKSLVSVECPSCHGPCENGDNVYGLPSPKRTKEWDEFWARYKADKAVWEDVERLRFETAPPAKPTTGSVAQIPVPYIEHICTPLIETLSHSAGLPANQLAGHAANLDFWISEARHCLTVIDGYQERFDRLRTGQAEYEKEHDVVGMTPPLRRGAKDQKRKELRRVVCESVERFLARCHREGLLSERDLEAALASLGI